MSKIASWFNPFATNDGVGDAAPQEGHYAPSQYLPPPGHGQIGQGCNPCNKVPWIPVAATYGQNTIIGFIQPSEIGNNVPHVNAAGIAPNLEYLHPPSSINNNAVDQFRPPSSEYGPPHQQYGPPHIPNQEYGPPTQTGPKEYLGPPPQQYVLPAGKIPLSPQDYGPPKQQLGPPAQDYLPLKQQTGPSTHDYEPPKHIGPPPIQYGPPQAHTTLSQEYGSPKQYLGPPAQEYGPPKQFGLPPQINRPSKTVLNIAPPNTNYGPPPVPSDQYGLPNKPTQSKYLPPTNLGIPPHLPPSLKPSYPPQNYPPIPRDHVMPPPYFNGQGKYVPPHFRPKLNGKIGPIPNKYGAPALLNPDMRPPPLNGFTTTYGVPLPNMPHLNNGYGPPIYTNVNNGLHNVSPPPTSIQTLPSVIPSDSYGAPVTGTDVDYGQSSLSTPGQYLPPIDELPFSSGSHHNIQISQSIPLPVFDDILEVPIALPNLNRLPVVPIHNAQDFNVNIRNIEKQIPGQRDSSFETHESNHQENHFIVKSNSQKVTTSSEITTQNKGVHQFETAKDVQIVPSIPVVNFLSSVEHPINLIQSPLVEVAASEFHDNSETYQESGYGKSVTKLSDNPIIVESNADSHPSASAQNATYHESDYHSESVKNLVTDSFENPMIAETVVPNPEFINQFLESVDNTVTSPKASKDLTQNPSEFTPPSLDYSDWSPAVSTISTSMVPPPIGESVWLSSASQLGEQIITTTKRPKQIQIIIPYTTNEKPAPFNNAYTNKAELMRTQGRRVPSLSEANNFEPKLSLYTQPPSSESVWLQHTEDYYNSEESKEVTAAVYTEKPRAVINIKDLLKKEKDMKYYQNLPFDIITLQKNIDGWTEQEYSKKVNRGLVEYQRASTDAQLVPSKKIPATFFSTRSINSTLATTPKYTNSFYDHEPESSNSQETQVDSYNDFESNFILTDISTSPSTTEESVTTANLATNTEPKRVEITRPAWDSKQVTFSSGTREKVYVVTPESWKGETTTPSTIAFSDPPKVGTKEPVTDTSNIAFSSPSFAISLKPGQHSGNDFNDSVRIIFSEWPHLINRLETTTTERSSSPHPLFGLMDLSSYTPPENSTIKTYSGHSKVITIVTPVSVTRKQDIKYEDLSDHEIK